MPIKISCLCGKKLHIKEALAGKRVKCSGCSRIVAVPKAAPPDPAAATDIEDMAFSLLDSPGPASPAPPPPKVCDTLPEPSKAHKNSPPARVESKTREALAELRKALDHFRQPMGRLNVTFGCLTLAVIV